MLILTRKLGLSSPKDVAVNREEVLKCIYKGKGDYEDNGNMSFRSICVVNYMWYYNGLSVKRLNPGIRVTHSHLIASVMLVGTRIIQALDLLRKSRDIEANRTIRTL